MIQILSVHSCCYCQAVAGRRTGQGDDEYVAQLKDLIWQLAVLIGIGLLKNETNLLQQ